MKILHVIVYAWVLYGTPYLSPLASLSHSLTRDDDDGHVDGHDDRYGIQVLLFTFLI